MTTLRKAGIENFHDLRHTTMTDLYDLGAGEFMVQEMPGHSSTKMTQIYTHVKDENLRARREDLADNNKPAMPIIFTLSEDD